MQALQVASAEQMALGDILRIEVGDEVYAVRTVGYGAMITEMLVAVIALIAACTLNPGEYFAINMAGEPAAVVATINKQGYPVTVAAMDELARDMGEEKLFGRAGGAPRVVPSVHR